MSKKKEFKPTYRVFTNNTSIVKVGCSYAGRMYYGIATCNPEDEFDFNFGYELAKLRCDRIICSEKVKRSQDKLDSYTRYYNYFKSCMEDEAKYLDSQKDAYLMSEFELDKFLNGGSDVD